MPKIDIDAVKRETGSSYPEPYASQMGGRAFQGLGDAAGLTQFGVNLVTMPPGAISSLRHWHSAEDEFVWVVSGELVLVQDGGETVLRAGDAAGFRAGDPDGHHLLNRSRAEASFLAIGTRGGPDTCTYSDVDLIYHSDGARGWFTTREGTFVKDAS
ncbi:MAG: cupin domain-containing protein [Alphaproteobacteria bacterium]|nr:cupin domain-containing protein [Alphaproteobacteria bacterium]